MDFLLFYAVILIAILGLGWTIYAIFFQSQDHDEKVSTNDSSSGKVKSKGTGEKKGTTKGKQKVKGRTISEPTETDDHPWLASVFKGHGENITGLHWSSNGKYLASCALDRTVLIWLAKDKDLVSKDHKNIRVNVPFDSAGQVYWSPDCKAFIVSRVDEKFLEVYKLGKKPDGSVGNITSAAQFKKVHDDKIIGMGIACSGMFIVSGSSDGKLVIWSLKGSILEELNFPGNKLFCVKVSNCGRYVFASGPSRELIIYEVTFVNDEYKATNIKWKLKGHESSVLDFDFNSDSSKIVTVTENGMWRLFDSTGNRVNIICEGTIGDIENADADADATPFIALSPDCRVISVGFGNMVHIFISKLGVPAPLCSSWTISCDMVRAMMFSSDGKFLVAASGRNIRVFHNVGGFRAATDDLKLKMQDATLSQALKTRLNAELQTALTDLRSLKVD